MDAIQKHFDNIASEYDYWKKKNWYYYDGVRRVYKELIPSASRVLEIGCGTGEILAGLNPSWGVGVDVSGEMIKKAKEKYAHFPNLKFFQSDALSFSTQENFDRIFLADVIEHLSDVDKSLENIAYIASSHTKVIISMANPLWEPILMVAEKLGLKMPEGPHNRIPVWRLIGIMGRNNFKLERLQYRLPFPLYIPLFSYVFNGVVERIPVLNKVGVIAVFVFRK